LAKEKYLVTSALPYANGDLHIGHIAGAYLPADIFVRFQRLCKNDVIYICGSDEHGAPISIKASQEGVSSKEIVAKYHKRIVDAFQGLNFSFDNFSETDRPIHYKISQQFFLELLKNGYITTHLTQQLYCPHCMRFLPDRYVEGECPYCHAPGARGDQCDACGKLIDATELINPICINCGDPPEMRETKNWFLDLPKFEPQLHSWIESKTEWKDNVKRFILGWLDSGLKERAITRDLDWGIPVPLEEAKGKVLYVWFEAPIGYLSSTVEWAQMIGQPKKWKDYWLDPDTKLIHFIGKDNIPFHTIIWPAVLMGQDESYVLPYDVPANEYLNLEGRKISTSKNWAVWILDFLENFSADALRYYLACNAPENKDADFVWKEFQQRYNSDMADVFGNFVNRVLKFSSAHFSRQIPFVKEVSPKGKLVLQEIADKREEIKRCYQTFKVRKATRYAVDLARFGNQYFDSEIPWQTIKAEPSKAAETMYICGELIRNLVVILYPIIPSSTEKIWKMLNFPGSIEEYGWEWLSQPLAESIKIGKIEPPFKKIPDELIDRQVEKLKAESGVSEQSITKEVRSMSENIDIHTFQKLDLRIAKIMEAEKIKGADKLLKLRINVGNQEKQIVAGIAEYYSPEELIGKNIVVVNNLEPSVIKGEKSEAMLLAAADNSKLALIITDKDIPAGTKVS
jgi:methionyl-tRNA synthetase